MLSLKISYLVAIALGVIIGYAWRAITTSSKADSGKDSKYIFPADLEKPKVEENNYDHLVEVRMESSDNYTYTTISIDGIVGGREKTFVSYRVRDAVMSHALIVYDDTFDHEGKSRLEAIGASRRNDIYTVGGRRYKVQFKQPITGGMVYSG